MKISKNSIRPYVSNFVIFVGESLENTVNSTKKSASDFFSYRPGLLRVLSYSGTAGLIGAFYVDRYTKGAYEPITSAFVMGILVCKIGNAAKEKLQSLKEKPIQQLS
ncbi:MAG TPA: hypothetical protein VLE95_01540 [Chlamydiales bacterium]|nr:hypothetical protein [Chlamydiales bacterium]